MNISFGTHNLAGKRTPFYNKVEVLQSNNPIAVYFTPNMSKQMPHSVAMQVDVLERKSIPIVKLQTPGRSKEEGILLYEPGKPPVDILRQAVNHIKNAKLT